MLEEDLVATRSAWDTLQGKVDSALVAFDLEGVGLRELVSQCLEGARGRLTEFTRRVPKQALQFTIVLMKSHVLEADLDLIGEGIGDGCTDAEWDTHLAAAVPLADRIMEHVDL